MTDSRIVEIIRNRKAEQRGECVMTENAYDFFGTRSDYERQSVVSLTNIGENQHKTNEKYRL